MARILVFDVNETLLDLAALDPLFERHLGAASLQHAWFTALKETWLVLTATGGYQDFGALAGHALAFVAEKHGQVLTVDARDEILSRIRALPAHDDAEPALRRLREGGFRLAALTNGTLSAARDQLRHAGLAPLFEAVFSADEVQRYKPAPEPYRMVAARLGVPAPALCMVAAHLWDLAGAAAAGYATAFVDRAGEPDHPAWPAPDLRAPTLAAVAQRLLEARA